jgi:hypothetical protein
VRYCEKHNTKLERKNALVLLLQTIMLSRVLKNDTREKLRELNTLAKIKELLGKLTSLSSIVLFYILK